MKRSRLITLVIILVIIASAAVYVNWRVVDFCTPVAMWAKTAFVPKVVAKVGKVGETQEPDETKAGEATVDVKSGADADEPNEPSEPNEPVEPDEPEKAVEPNEPNEPAEPNEPNEPNEPGELMENVNLKDVEMKDLIDKLAKWTGKVIIPTDEAMKQKITIYSAEKVPRDEALSLIYSALATKGFVCEHTDRRIYLKPLKDAKLLSVPVIPFDFPLAAIENKEQVVQKFFKLVNYSPTAMSNIVSPLVGEYGYVSADENTSQLQVIDTVANLMRIRGVIAQFDVPGAEQTKTEIFEISQGDPAEIVQVLRILLGGGDGKGAKSGSSGRSRPDRDRRDRGDRGKKDKDRGKGAVTSVVVGPSGAPIILIPEPRRKWIIARASPEDIELIREWIVKLDKKEPVEPEHETVVVRFADVDEVAERLNEVLQRMPGTELQTSVLVQPLVQAGQIVIYGRADIREMVKNLINEIDIPTGLEQRVFDLNHADPEQVKQNIDELYGEGEDGYRGYYYWRFRRDRSPSDIVKVIAFPTMQQVTVIASPENMIKIEAQIKEWDVPIDVDKVKPLIITLHNTDPVQMAALLTRLFSEETEAWRPYWWWWGDEEESKKKIVGPLYGQLTFEDVPGTKKIIVISKIPEAYKVIERFVKELDEQEMAEVPKVITLKYADPEDLSERMNAMFNEPGTPVIIRRSESGLSDYSMEGTQGNPNPSGEDETAQGEYTPWWSSGARRLDEMPISNVIGRIRFIPDPHSKSILVLAPREFMASIEDVIKKLDVRGKQVLIKAIIVEVDHSDVTSLGLQLKSGDEGAFGALDENAIIAINALSFLETHGSLTLGVTADVASLIDFLQKRTDAKILNQQSLWTKDNEEADFFKGENVPFLAGRSFSTEGARETQDVDFKRVGMTLRVRPSITPENNVDMIVNVMISQLTGQEVNKQPIRTEMETTTNMIVRDGETVMLGGILFQRDTTIERKLPLLGDVPLVGGLFRHSEAVERNNEMLVFITPYVIDEPNRMPPKTIEELERPKEKLETVLDQFEATFGGADANSNPQTIEELEGAEEELKSVLKQLNYVVDSNSAPPEAIKELESAEIKLEGVLKKLNATIEAH